MKRLLLVATAWPLLTGVAYAQSYSGSGSNATATNTSASLSNATSNPRVNVIGNPIGNGASSSYSNASANTRSSSSASAVGNKSSMNSTTNITLQTGSGGSGTGASTPVTGSDPSVHYSGSYTVRNTPEVLPPSVVGGNTCAVGASAGLALPGFGIAGGATWADKACERRQQAALMYNMGRQAVAYALMCQDDHVREAMRLAGEPCAGDRIAAAAPAAASPAPVAAPARIVTAAAVAPPPAPKPGWCTAATVSPAHLSTLSEGQQIYVRKNCGL